MASSKEPSTSGSTKVVVTPLVSLVTKPVAFDVTPPTPEGAMDREIAAKLGEGALQDPAGSQL